MAEPYSLFIATGGAAVGWATKLAGDVAPYITLGTLILTIISIYLVTPKLIARLKKDYRRVKSWFK
jgi:hypothetical protein